MVFSPECITVDWMKIAEGGGGEPGSAPIHNRTLTSPSPTRSAGRAGIHRTYFDDAERGVRNVGIKNVVAIARGLEVTPSELLKKIR